MAALNNSSLNGNPEEISISTLCTVTCPAAHKMQFFYPHQYLVRGKTMAIFTATVGFSPGRKLCLLPLESVVSVDQTFLFSITFKILFSPII
jgi:hypothetical protein